MVQNAFASFFQGVARGRFPQLDDRDNLWKLLVVITVRKAVDQHAHEHSRRRGGGTVRAATLRGHARGVQSVAFSPDGRYLFSRDLQKRWIAWDVESGKALPDVEEELLPGNHTRHGPLFAQIDETVIHLMDLRLSKETLAERRWLTRRRPAWHLDEADACEKANNWFAAAFHLEQVIDAGPPSQELLARLDRARTLIPEPLPMPREVKE